MIELQSSSNSSIFYHWTTLQRLVAASTTPAPSQPTMRLGTPGAAKLYAAFFQSTGLTEAALMRMRTSPAPGVGTAMEPSLKPLKAWPVSVRSNAAWVAPSEPAPAPPAPAPAAAAAAAAAWAGDWYLGGGKKPMPSCTEST